MKALRALPAIALAGVCLCACGSAGLARQRSSEAVVKAGGAQPGEVSTANSTTGYMRGDQDTAGDDKGRSSDDLGRWLYGGEAAAAQRQALTAVVRRYYAAASEGNGAAACALIYSKLSKNSNLERVLPAEYRPAPGSSVLRGKGCAGVESLLFEIDHQKLAQESATLQVIDARVHGAAGRVLLGFRSSGEIEIPLHREAGAWKIDALLGRPPP